MRQQRKEKLIIVESRELAKCRWTDISNGREGNEFFSV